jgi:hypothetical protein
VAVRCFPAWQDRSTVRNVCAVTLDGLTVPQNGDNTDTMSYPRIAECGKVDAILANGSSGLLRCTQFAKPRQVITAHENELGQPASNRKAYQNTYQCLGRGKGRPLTMVLDWGGSVAFPECFGEVSTTPSGAR